MGWCNFCRSITFVSEVSLVISPTFLTTCFRNNVQGIHENRTKKLLLVIAGVGMLALYGCGGGTTASTSPTLVSGVASKGPFNGSTVCAYAIVANNLQLRACNEVLNRIPPYLLDNRRVQ